MNFILKNWKQFNCFLIKYVSLLCIGGFNEYDFLAQLWLWGRGAFFWMTLYSSNDYDCAWIKILRHILFQLENTTHDMNQHKCQYDIKISSLRKVQMATSLLFWSSSFDIRRCWCCRWLVGSSEVQGIFVAILWQSGDGESANWFISDIILLANMWMSTSWRYSYHCCYSCEHFLKASDGLVTQTMRFGGGSRIFLRWTSTPKVGVLTY